MKIGITGGIGSGKSTVTQHLQEKGFQVIDADTIAHDIVGPGKPALMRIIEAFGDDLLREDRTLDRKRLADLVFNSEEELEKLNSIMREEILSALREGLDHPETDPVFADIPLLFENRLESCMDEVWLVTAPENVRIERVRKRDGISSDQVTARINNQMPEEERIKKADVIIQNDCPLEELYSRIDVLLENRYVENK